MYNDSLGDAPFPSMPVLLAASVGEGGAVADT